MSRWHWGRRGFTLLEAILVLGLTSLLMVMTAVETNQAADQLALRATVDTVMQAYENVRKQALVEGDSFMLYFYKQQVSYYRRSIDPQNKVFEYTFPTG